MRPLCGDNCDKTARQPDVQRDKRELNRLEMESQESGSGMSDGGETDGGRHSRMTSFLSFFILTRLGFFLRTRANFRTDCMDHNRGAWL